MTMIERVKNRQPEKVDYVTQQLKEVAPLLDVRSNRKKFEKDLKGLEKELEDIKEHKHDEKKEKKDEKKADKKADKKAEKESKKEAGKKMILPVPHSPPLNPEEQKEYDELKEKMKKLET